MSLARVRDHRHWDTATRLRYTLGRAVFGDRCGLVVFLSCLCLFGVVWRTEIFISDTYTLANGLYSLSNGQLFMTEAAYGPTLETPGANLVDGRRIARNYGAIVLSLPFWLLLEGLAAVTSLRLALVGLWSLALLAAVVQLGTLLDDDDIVTAGGIGVLLFFGVNVALARSLDPTATHLYALQLFHMTVAAFAPVIFYRLISRIETRTVALLGTALLVLATPLALWAPVPKRHAITGTVVVAVAYSLYRSRTEADGVVFASPVQFRALAYAFVGLYTWVHAPEALLLFVVLLAVDVPTAADNSVRTLAIVGTVFLLSLVPFVLTNIALSGSPIQPPRLLGGGAEQAAGAASSQSSDSSSVTTVLGFLAPVLSIVDKMTRPLQLLARELTGGMAVFYTRPETVFNTLVRSGDAGGALDLAGRESVNLSFLESAPILAGLVGGVPVVWRKARRTSTPTRLLAATTAVDLFAVLLCVTLTFLYASRLPLHAQVTVRYLFPLFALGVYLLVRLPVVRRTLDAHWQVFAWTTAIATLIGGQMLVVFFFWTVVGLGEAFQLHAVLALLGAVPLALWTLVGQSEGWAGRSGAALLGALTAMTTLFVLLVTVEYYPIGDSQMLPIVRTAAELLELL